MDGKCLWAIQFMEKATLLIDGVGRSFFALFHAAQPIRGPPSILKSLNHFKIGVIIVQIKIIRDGVASDWFTLTKRLHAKLQSNTTNAKPDYVIVRIGDLFPGSPESSQTVKLEFELFTVLAREFVLEENRRHKKDARYRSSVPLDDIDSTQNCSLVSSVEADFEQLELRRKVERAKNLLTLRQKRRFLMHFEEGLPYRRIAEIEGGLHHKDIEESVAAALKKFKKYFE